VRGGGVVFRRNARPAQSNRIRGRECQIHERVAIIPAYIDARASHVAAYMMNVRRRAGLRFVLPLQLALLVGACTNNDNQSLPAGSYSPPAMVIAPFISGEYFCDDAANDTNVTNDDGATALCAAEGKSGADRVTALLDSLGPVTSPSGNYQLGYTLDMPLLRYVKQIDGQWAVDQSLLSNNLQLLVDVKRPAVIYLSANHFTDSNQSAAFLLASNTQNLMWAREGPLAPEIYFGSPILAWTLYDQTAPITLLRKEVFAAAVSAICRLPPSARERIVAVSVLGETHELFPDFVAGPSFGIPSYEATDYSPIAAAGFQTWLAQQFGTITALNNAIAANFASFESIEPPSKDIRTESVTSYFQDIDPFAAGYVPVYGWIFDQLGRNLQISIYLDGSPIGVAQTGLNRTDVTDARPSIRDPNVGYRLNLDYRNIAFGIHTLEVLVSANGAAPLRLTKQLLVIMDRYQDTPPTIPYLETGAPPMSTDPNLLGTIDGPVPLQSLIYNPIAASWLEYRNLSVRSYIERFAQLASGSCLPREKIFSHQITPSLDGSWNGDLLAADASKLPDQFYNQGTTLYGGAAFGRAFFDMKERLGWSRYSVSEMHPQVPLAADQYLQMFNAHRSSGAVFVAPYYMSALPDRLSGASGLEIYRIAPDNPLDGSNLYWQSIQSIMRD
jgi:hypothetical protein